MISSNVSPALDTPAPAREREEPVERDSLQFYLREIGKTPLLSREEEAALFKRIRKGDAAAREHMIQANLRLVVKIALDFRDFGLPLLDLISEGNVGLIKAVDRFDPGKGGKLSTYAGWWIRQSVQRALANQSKTIRLPVHLIAKISSLRRTARKLSEDLGRDPTDEELARELGLPVHKVSHLRSVSVQPASLDAPLGGAAGEPDSSSLGEVVRDENAVNPFDRLGDKNASEDLHAVVESLDQREAEIIRLRFGLNGRTEMTLQEVGARFHVTRERIRQLEDLALRKMRRLMADRDAPRAHDDQADRLRVA
jgi:RNA polymerase primary sigma factor